VPKSRPGHCLGSHIEGIESNKWARTFFEGLSRKFLHDFGHVESTADADARE